MTPRELVLSALSGHSVSPIPVDVYLNAIYPQLEAGLFRHFGIPPSDHEALLQVLGSGFRFGRPAYIGPPMPEAVDLGPPAFPSKKVSKSIWGTWDGVETYTDSLPRPLQAAENIDDVHAHSWPDPNWFDYGRLGWFNDEAEGYLPVPEWARRYSKYARWVTDWQPLFSRVMDLFGMETGLLNLAYRPDLIGAAVAHIEEFLQEYYSRLAQACEGHADVFGFGDDFAGQSGLLISPEMWREFFLPVWKRLFPIAHKHRMRAALHSCGAVREVLGDLVDAGLDLLEVTQVSAAGMDPVEIKREFGAHLIFYGGVDVQHILPDCRVDEVRSEVRRLIEILGENGGYILASCHFMMDDIPVENALAMYDEARSFQPTWAI